VSAHDDVAALADYAVQEFGYVDIWINNAGMSHNPNVRGLMQSA
jgi:NAD(P)-dependent dehydrogenase (short-subunit alcohol dehydrogenase family)